MKQLYRLFATLLVIVLAMALCAPAFAEEAGGSPPPLIVDDAGDQKSDGSAPIVGEEKEPLPEEAPAAEQPVVTPADEQPVVTPAAEQPVVTPADNAAPSDSDGGDSPAETESNNPVRSDAVGVLPLNDSMLFDFQTREYCYPIADSGNEVRANVANGMIVNGPVKIKGVTVIIYRNSKLWEGDVSSITEPGDYVVMAQFGNQTPRLFSFTVVGSAVNSVYTYNLPSGMVVLDATRDGEPTEHSRGAVPMQEDGTYHVEYEYISIKQRYALDLTVDRTPPDVHFEGDIDSHNRVHSALRFSGLEPGDTLIAKLDGATIEIPVRADGTGEILDSGVYYITAYDAAGNSSEYAFTILMYLNESGIVFFALLIVSVIALAVYILIKRKRLQIG